MRYRSLLLVLIICLCALAVRSQRHSPHFVDSLYAVVSSNAADTSKIRAAATILRIIYKKDHDSAIRMSRTWLPLAFKWKMKKQVGLIYWSQASAYNFKGIADSSITIHLKALKWREEMGDTEGLV